MLEQMFALNKLGCVRCFGVICWLLVCRWGWDRPGRRGGP
jgi:hypothetical protein